MEKMPKGIIRSSFFAPWQEQAGMAATPAYFALRAQRLMRESGVTREHLAAVVVKNRRNGVNNPDAMFRKEVTAEDVAYERREMARPAALTSGLNYYRALVGLPPADLLRLEQPVRVPTLLIWATVTRTPTARRSRNQN